MVTEGEIRLLIKICFLLFHMSEVFMKNIAFCLSIDKI